MHVIMYLCINCMETFRKLPTSHIQFTWTVTQQTHNLRIKILDYSFSYFTKDLIIKFVNVLKYTNIY